MKGLSVPMAVSMGTVTAMGGLVRCAGSTRSRRLAGVGTLLLLALMRKVAAHIERRGGSSAERIVRVAAWLVPARRSARRESLVEREVERADRLEGDPAQAIFHFDTNVVIRGQEATGKTYTLLSYTVHRKSIQDGGADDPPDPR